MYDLQELEEKWYRYQKKCKKKQNTLIAVGIFSTICIIGVVILLTANSKQKENINNVVQNTQEIAQPTQTLAAIQLSKDFNLTSLTKPNKTIVVQLKLQEPLQQETLEQSEDGLIVYKETYTEHKTYKSAIDLARAYLKQNDFKHARQYAIEANSLEPSKDEGWEIFANASIKLGKKQDVVNAVTKFNSIGNGTSYTRTLEKELKEEN